jgi:Ca-activated chloride channel homolog
MTPNLMLATLTEEEVSRCPPAAEEPGFGALRTARGTLPLKALDVQARLEGLLAEVGVTQTFVNTHAEPLEATYVFPLPDRAAVTAFRLEVAGRTVEGVLQERGAARREYDRALRAGHRAAISEEERPGVFTLRVGNLPPGEAATVRLRLSGPLAHDSGEATFRFPLVVAPRYVPGSPLPGPSVGSGTACDTDAVPDASRISPPVLLPGFPNPVRLSLTVDVAPSAVPLSDFRCSLHAVLEAVSDDGARRILLQPGERADRDFVLRFRVGDGAVRTALALSPDADGAAEGTFALTVLPPAGPGQGPRPRDVVFVLDRSGSMAGWKLATARRALARMVESLGERDRFTVYAFDDVIETPPAFRDLSLQPATDRNRFAAVELLDRVEARGGTEMAQPLALAVQHLAGSTRPAERILVLITDGQVGNEDQILRALAGQLRDVRVFALGIDRAVNAAFLRRLAELGGGDCELVESEARLEEVLGRIHRRISAPVLTGLRLEASGLQVREGSLVPARLPDLFAGAPLCILGRYAGRPEGRIRLTGTLPDGGTWSETVPARVGRSAALPAVWARGHVRDLEDRFVTGRGDARMLERQILETALRFGVLCRFTAFVAVDRARVIDQGEPLHRVTQPVEMPSSWQQQGLGGGRGASATQAPPDNVLDPDLRELRRELSKDLTAGPDMVTMGKLPQTPRTKKVIELAIEEARNLGHDQVDSEHLLLGLLGVPEGVAAQFLRNRGLDLEGARDEIRTVFAREGKATGRAWPKTSSTYERFTDRARRVMQLANQEAQRFNHEYIGTEHIVLGLIKQASGLAAELLKNGTRRAPASRRIDLPTCRRRGLQLLQKLQHTDETSKADRLIDLYRVAEALGPLLRDLRAIGVSEPELRPLGQLLRALRHLLARASPTDAEVDQIFSHARAILEALAGSPEELPDVAPAR